MKGTVLAIVAAAVSVQHALAGVEWRLAFADEFDGERLNPEVWGVIPPGESGYGAWDAWMTDRPEFAKLENGMLVLTGDTNSVPRKGERAFLTGGIMTKGKLNFRYGRLEIRARFEDQKGAWPAFWMLREREVDGWPMDGEIDILERLNSDAFVYQTVHTWASRRWKCEGNGAYAKIRPGCFNVYAIEWYPDRIVWTVNGSATFIYSRLLERPWKDVTGRIPERWPFDRPFYLMLDMQLGGDWVGEIDAGTLPVRAFVDYVRFYVGKDEDGRLIGEAGKPKPLPRVRAIVPAGAGIPERASCAVKFPVRDVDDVGKIASAARADKGVWLDFEGFDANLADRAVDALHKAHVQDDRIAIVSTNAEALAYVSSKFPAVRRIWRVGVVVKAGKVTRITFDTRDATNADVIIEDLLAEANRLGVRDLCVDAEGRFFSDEIVSRLRANGFRISVENVKDRRTALHYGEIDGIDSIVTTKGD